MRTTLALLLAVFVCTCVRAQADDGMVVDLSLDRIAHQKKAMLVLGGWAVGNIGIGLALRANSTGEQRRFHEMNAIWNVVNLGIAGFGYYSALRKPAMTEAFMAYNKDLNFQKVLLFNAGLDVGYVLGGLYLTERARREGTDTDQLKGYGKSIMLQGAFLLVFDVVNYLIANGRGEGYRLLLAPVEDGLGLSLTF